MMMIIISIIIIIIINKDRKYPEYYTVQRRIHSTLVNMNV